MLPIILKISDVASKEPFHVRFYKMKQFQHFQYVYNQTAGCQSRLPKLQNNVVSTTQMAKDMFIKIRILGEFKDEDLNLISKKAGRFIMTYYNEKEVLPFVFNFSLSLNLIQFCYRKNQINRRSPIWEAMPVVCFQNHHSSKSKLKVCMCQVCCTCICKFFNVFPALVFVLHVALIHFVRNISYAFKYFSHY